MNRFRELRRKKGFSQANVAEALHVHQTAVSQWELGKSFPDVATLKKICALYDVSIEYLIGSAPQDKAAHITNRVQIPVLGEVVAGIPLEAIQEILDYEEIPAAMAQTGEFFGLKVKGNSMTPRIIEGDVVIVRRQAEASTGDIVVAMVNGNEATVKKLRHTDGGLMLIPLNPSHEPLIFTDQEVQSLPVTIIGKVVELRGKF